VNAGGGTPYAFDREGAACRGAEIEPIEGLHQRTQAAHAQLQSAEGRVSSASSTGDLVSPLMNASL